MSAPEWTPGPWALNRLPGAEEFAAMKGETLAEHDGYYRATSGAWIVTYAGDEEDMPGGPICEVSFKGTAKRGQSYCAPDPEGQANARLIAAAPEMYDALEQLCSGMDDLDKAANRDAYTTARAALAKASGQ